MATPNNVEDISSKDRGGKTGNVFVVDPNPPGMDVIPPEDMFIYVKFSAYPRSRTTYGGNTLEGDPIVFDSGIEGEVHFISTKISYKDGKLDPPLQKSYATTEWTNIGGFKDEQSRSAGILEGFGIKSINIKYNASLVPVVDITFTDVRGSGLFDVIKDNDRKSPYSIFFKMPYPVFRLSVKGYFGQKVDYCLHMVNWTSNFDGSTGNFDISANFLGFQQAFLNDMVIGNIIGAVNTSKGFNNLNDIYDRRQSEIGTSGDLNIRKLDEFFTKISKLQVETEIIKTDLDSFDFLKDLNGKLNLLKQIQSFIGTDIGKQPSTNTNGSSQGVTDSEDYLKTENNTTTISKSNQQIKDNNLKNKVNYLLIRDYLLINSSNRGSFKTYIETLKDIITTYRTFLDSGDRNKDYNPTESLKILSDKSKAKISGTPPSDENRLTDKDKQLIESFFLPAKNATITDEKYWVQYLSPISLSVNNDIKTEDLQTIFSSFSNENSPIYLKNNYKGGNPDNNSNFELSLISGDTDQFYTSTLKKETTVIVADFRAQRELLQNRIIEVRESIKQQQEIVQSEINEKILKNFLEQFNFNPTVDNCFEILANNTQAMIETIYDISSESEQESKSSIRNKILSNFETDVPAGINRVAWPTVYQRNDDNSLQEIYIGEISNVSSVAFPEWAFTEEVFQNIIERRKSLGEITKASVLKNGLDTDNWFPINPLDYKTNPWIRLNVLNSEVDIYNELLKQISYRSVILQNYSRFSPITGLKQIPSSYAKFDAIAANKTIFNKNVREILSNLLLKLENREIKYEDSIFFKENIEQLGNNFKFIETDEILPEYDGFILSGKYFSGATYVSFDDSNIINNSKKLFPEIKKEQDYLNITDSSAAVNVEQKGNGLYYQNKYSTANNYTTNNSFNPWFDSVSEKLFISNNSVFTSDLKNSKLTDFNPSGGTTGIDNSQFLNLTYFNTTTDCNYERVMTQSRLYSKQNSNYARALLLLGTFPFRSFELSFLDSVFPNNNYDGARIVRLPKLYMMFIGGTLWRYEEGKKGVDPIKSNIYLLKSDGTENTKCNYSKFINSYKEYLLFSYGSSEAPIIQQAGSSIKIKIEDNLTKLPSSVKKYFIDTFKNWVDGNNRFNDNKTGDFELNMTYYINDPNESFSDNITENNKSSGEFYILRDLKETTDLIIFNPEIFNPNRISDNLEFDVSDIDEYIKNFRLKFDEIGKENTNGQENTVEENEKREKRNNKLKLQIYNYFKNINSKWVGAEKKSFNICGGADTNDLIDYFRFVDRGWRNIGDKATFNLKSFLTLGSNLDTSVYLFIAKILRDSNFLFQILPNYINYRDKTEVAKIFQPQTTLKNNESTGPLFCCIYVGGASEVLDIGERSNYYFKNDGFTFKSGEELPADMVGPDDSSLVAFRVAFGAQNQTIFKNVSLNQQEHKETGEYFRALTDLVDKRGGTQKTYVGSDLLRLFRTRSYTCKVDALGCMNIQPLMYFDLQNVPFFNGAYLITSVNHSISPNHMTTNFQGVRQSKFISPPVEEITADLEIDLNESTEIPKIEFTNLNINNPLYTIGVRTEIEGGDDFDFGNFTPQLFKDLGVKRSSDNEYQLLGQNIETIFKQEGLLSNSQVTMALTAMLANSNNLNRKEKEVEKGIELKDGTETLYYTSDLTGITDRLILSDVKGFSNLSYSASYLSSIVTTDENGSPENIAYKLKAAGSLDESNFNKTIEDSKEKIKKQIVALDTDSPSFEVDSKLLTNKLKSLEKQEDELIEKLPYFNILNGDAYRFRPRGYLYLIGRKNYYDLTRQYFPNFPTQYNRYIINPNTSIDTEINTIKTSLSVWKGFSGSSNTTAYKLSSIPKDGSAATFKASIDLVYQGFGPQDEVSFNVFEKVLTFCNGKDGQPLIDFDNPRGGL